MQKQQIYHIIINSLPVGFSLVDKDGIIMDFNPAAEKITGYSKKMNTLIHPAVMRTGNIESAIIEYMPKYKRHSRSFVHSPFDIY
jgi:PAS domain S-box-containing protein